MIGAHLALTPGGDVSLYEGAEGGWFVVDMRPGRSERFFFYRYDRTRQFERQIRRLAGTQPMDRTDFCNVLLGALRSSFRGDMAVVCLDDIVWDSLADLIWVLASDAPTRRPRKEGEQ